MLLFNCLSIEFTMYISEQKILRIILLSENEIDIEINPEQAKKFMNKCSEIGKQQGFKLVEFIELGTKQFRAIYENMIEAKAKNE